MGRRYRSLDSCLAVDVAHREARPVDGDVPVCLWWCDCVFVLGDRSTHNPPYHPSDATQTTHKNTGTCSPLFPTAHTTLSPLRHDVGQNGRRRLHLDPEGVPLLPPINDFPAFVHVPLHHVARVAPVRGEAPSVFFVGGLCGKVCIYI